MVKKQLMSLFLVILLSLAGCLEEELVPEQGEESPNQEPIIYGGFGVCYRECYFDGNSYHSLVYSNEFFTVDPDGNVTDFGMDWDNDFSIDWTFPWADWSNPNSSSYPEFNYSMISIIEPDNYNDSDSYCSTDYMNIISIDENGLKEIIPVKWRFKWHSEEQYCITGISS